MSCPGKKTLCLVLLVLTVSAYLPVWSNDFVDFDDEPYITSNPHVIGGLSKANFYWAWSTLQGKYWQPLTWLSLQLDAHFFSKQGSSGNRSLSPAAFHGQNLFWHSVNVLLVFTLWERLTGARWHSFLVAGLFAVHPLHVESVAWAVERKDVLSLFFGLLTLWAYVRYRDKPEWGTYALMLAAFLASLLAKPMLLTLPFVLLLLDYWPLRRMTRACWHKRVVEKVPLFLMAAAIAAITLVNRSRTGAAMSLDALPLSARLANAAAAYGWYARATLWPANLAVLYPHPHRDWSPASVLVGSAVLLSVTALALWQARRRPWLACGWLWFAGALVPVLGLAQGGEQAWADRFCYWPHVGLFMAIVWGAAELVVRCRVPVWAWQAAASLLLVALAGASWHQVGFWRDTETLWSHALVATVDNDLAHLHLGKHQLEHGRLDESVAHLAEAVHLRPNVPVYRYSLGVALLMLGKAPEAAEQFWTALQIDGRDHDAWYNLGVARLQEGQVDKAVRALRQALRLQPDSADAWAWLGRALWRQGEREEAVACFHKAVQRDPRQGWAWHGLGRVHLAEGELDRAAAAFKRALQVNPHLVIAYSDLGLVLSRQQAWRAAVSYQGMAVRTRDEADQLLVQMSGRPSVRDGILQAVLFRCRLAYSLGHLGDPRSAKIYREALQRQPDWPAKFLTTAWRLATDADGDRRDPELAFEMISQAVQAVGDPDARMLDVLAAAQAARKHFTEAVEVERRALRKAKSAADSTLLYVIRDHLRLFEQGKSISLQRP